MYMFMQVENLNLTKIYIQLNDKTGQNSSVEGIGIDMG